MLGYLLGHVCPWGKINFNFGLGSLVCKYRSILFFERKSYRLGLSKFLNSFAWVMINVLARLESWEFAWLRDLLDNVDFLGRNLVKARAPRFWHAPVALEYIISCLWEDLVQLPIDLINILRCDFCFAFQLVFGKFLNLIDIEPKLRKPIRVIHMLRMYFGSNCFNNIFTRRSIHVYRGWGIWVTIADCISKLFLLRSVVWGSVVVLRTKIWAFVLDGSVNTL